MKRKYGLTMDEREMEAARNVLVSCVSVEMVFYRTEPTPTPTPAPTLAPQADDPLELYDDNGNGRISCAEANAPTASRRVERGHPAYELYAGF